MWHVQYQACCAELAQWDALAELGKACQDAGALLESLWKLGDYEYLATNVLQGAAVSLIISQCKAVFTRLQACSGHACALQGPGAWRPWWSW